MAGNRILVTAQRHSCSHVPVRISTDALKIARTGVPVLRDVATDRLTPGQLVRDADREFLCWIIEDLPVGETREYELVTSNTQPESGVQLLERQGEVEFRINGDLFTSYHYSDVPRPFMYPIAGPNGLRVTRSYPMRDDVPGETTDHKHHRSLWVAHGDVNGTDNWSEEKGHGRQVHKRFLEMTSGPVFARIRALNDWVDANGKKQLEEERTITIYNTPDSSRIIDIAVDFRATEGDVKFGDTKEGGIVAIRVATTMDGNKGGVITNSYGGVTEAENWGKPAHWCDYSGPVEGQIVGIAIFDNPGNFRYPTRWHVRDYGLFAANPFALSSYMGDPSLDGSHIVKSGGTFRFAYRIYVHDGDASVGGVREQYHGYINPPTIHTE